MQHLIEHMKTAALAAGAYMRGSTDTDHTEKSNRKDFVTEADLKCQEIIVTQLTDAYPDEVILSEEHDEEDREQLYEPDFTGFVIDPIDGTYNFKRGMKSSAVSIGYIKDGEPVAGVAFDPYRDELYWAEEGKGAFCNGEPIHVSDYKELDHASVATGNSYDEEMTKRNLQRQIAIYDQTGNMPWTSCLGSAVLIMVWIARGRLDAYHQNCLKPWDNAAAILILREAGGEVVRLTGERALFTNPDILAGNPKIVALLRDAFSKIDDSLLS